MLMTLRRPGVFGLGRDLLVRSAFLSRIIHFRSTGTTSVPLRASEGPACQVRWRDLLVRSLSWKNLRRDPIVRSVARLCSRGFAEGLQLDEGKIELGVLTQEPDRVVVKDLQGFLKAVATPTKLKNAIMQSGWIARTPIRR